MKKFYLLSLLVCLSLGVFGQSTVYIYATGAPMSYTTAWSSAVTRSDDAIQLVPFIQRGYAVFDLASNLPTGAVIASAALGFDITAVSGMGAPGNTIRGYNGDLSLITAPATLYSTMGGSAPTIYSTTWPGTVSNALLPTNSTAVTFIQNSFSGGTATGFVSTIWAAGGLSYDITGETGTATPSGAHAPYLRVTYNCPGMTVTANATPSTVCENEAFTLHSGGTGVASYMWSGPAGYSSTMANPPTIATGLPSTGEYTLIATSAGTCYAKIIVTVNVNPAPSSAITVANAPAFCAGGNAVLTTSAGTGFTYQWYDNGVVVAGATDDTYTANDNGNYKVKVTDAIGCTSTTAVGTPVVLLSGPAPLTPGNPVRLCLGDNSVLMVNTNGVTAGVDFQWQKDSVDIAGATNNTYNATTSGVYNVVINVPANGCMAASVTDTVIVNAYPTPPVSLTGTTVHTTPTYAAYQWFLNTVAIPGATNASVVPAANGSYRVRVTDNNGCSAYSASYAYNTVGVAQMNQAEISIYPNPATGTLHIDAPVAVKAVITGMEGRVYMKQANAQDMDISKLANGLYIISLYNDAGMRIAVQQVVKQ